MNLVTEKEILDRVKEDSQMILKSYLSDERAFLGVFVVEQALFGQAQQPSDIHTMAILIPSLQEIAVGTTPIKGAYLTSNDGEGKIYLENFLRIFDDTCDEYSNVRQIFYTPYFYINPFYQKAFSKLQKDTSQMHNMQRLSAILENKIDLDKLSEVLTKILKQSFEINIGMQEELFTSMTKKEKEALTFILNTIGDEGTISISTAIKDSGISRPVFTSLLEKLDRYNGAEVRNQGVKGTYINFFDSTLSKFEVQ